VTSTNKRTLSKTGGATFETGPHENDTGRDHVQPPSQSAVCAPLAVDLFCGRGGWTKGLLAAGFRVIGIDVEPQPDYPGEFVRADIRQLDGKQYLGAVVVVASPPCTGFSSLNFLNKHLRGVRPRPMDFELVAHGLRVIGEIAPRFWAVENVAGAIAWFEPMLGRPTATTRPFYLWGSFPPFLLPTSAPVKVKTKAVGVARNGRPAIGRQYLREKYGIKNPMVPGWNGKDRDIAAKIAEIPAQLAVPFARACMSDIKEEAVAVA